MNISFKYNPDAASDFIISNSEIKSIIIKNQFFSNFKATINYIQANNLPKNISYWSDSTLQIQELPVLYGKDKIDETENSITLHADLIASAFFMLTRWEEIVDADKDLHGRSIAKNSIAYQYHFLQRPVVNEYVELIWNVLQKAGYTGKRKSYEYRALVTHDVDQQYQWPDFFTSIKHIAGDILKRNDFKMAGRNLKSWYQTLVLNKQDPFDTYDTLLNLANEYSIKAYFNIIISRSSEHDMALPINDKRLLNLISKIECEGHTIGFHPGYNTYLIQSQFDKELDELQSITKQKIISGRQHFLRFQNPDTWRLWDNAGMEWESSMGYADLPGFRCGICLPFSIFDVRARKKLKVKERPVIVMDATLIYYMKEWSWDQLENLKTQCKKFKGEWVTIWHNDLVNHPLLENFENIIYK